MSESVQHASFGQAQAYTRLLESLYDATVVSLRDGELLQGRLQKEAVKGDDEVITTISSLVGWLGAVDIDVFKLKFWVYLNLNFGFI